MSKQTRAFLLNLIRKEYKNTVRFLKRKYDKSNPLLKTAIENAKANYKHCKTAVQHADTSCVSHMLTHSRNYGIFNHAH